MQRKIVPDIVKDQVIALVAPTVTVRDAAEIMAERHIGALLVGDGDKMVGIFTERDVLTRVVARNLDPDTTPLEAVMTKNPDTVRPDEMALDALARMRAKGYRHLPVVEDDKLVGIVSIRDLYSAVTTELESDIKEREAFIFDTGYGSG
jgi:CBS domain-containing protein